MSRQLTGRVIENRQIGQDVFKITVESELVSQNALPGQFANVRCGRGLTPLLRRPFSICSVDREKGSFDLGYQVRGEGTRLLSETAPGSQLDFIAPLGKPFSACGGFDRIAVVGGGIGVFPLLFLLQIFKCRESSAFLGFRSSEQAVLLDEFSRHSGRLVISTDDGSLGEKGLVTRAFERELDKRAFDMIYACGPVPMLKEVGRIADERGLKCQVSLEQRMGCGIGVCYVCACKVKRQGKEEYLRTCREGPVFWSREVVWDD